MSNQPQSVLVAIAPPRSGLLTEAVTDRIAAAVAGHARLASPLWLADGEAWECPIEPAADTGQASLGARDAVAGLPIDVNIVTGAPAHRRKKLLVADMESTIIAEECLDEIAGFAGLRGRIAAVTARAMRGEVEFEAALRERVALLMGLDAQVLDEVYARVTLVPGAETLIRTMQSSGACCALVSGGFTCFAEKVAERLGFDAVQANILEIADGKLTGSVIEPILGRDAKLAALMRLAAQNGLDRDETLAVGDGANDLAMIKAAGLGVAFRAKPIVAREASASIVHGDLTGLLYLQGYRHDELAA